MKILGLVLLTMVFFATGCHIHRGKNGRFEFGFRDTREVVNEMIDSAFDTPDETDRLWRQGYGYNNPNPDRMRKGLPLLNFDGSEVK